MIKLILMSLTLLMLFAETTFADSVDIPHNTINTCGAYAIFPAFFRTALLRTAIQNRLEELDAPKVIIECSGERHRLKEVDGAIIKLCSQGIGLDSASYSIIQLHVASCYEDNE